MKKTLLLVLFLVSIPPTTFHCSKIVDNLADWFVSDSDEVAMGDNFYKQIRANPSEYPVMDTVGNEKHKKIVDYIDSIGKAVASKQTARPENKFLKYKFTVIDIDTVINAFAIPGGNVFIYRGLIRAARNEAEIAGVMAHEIAHITQKHGVQTMVKAAGITYVEKLIFGDSSLLVDVANTLLFLKFSRENEFEADSCAAEFLIKAGYNPSGMKTFLQLLAQNSNWTFEPLSTHPDTDDRVKRVGDLIATKPGSVNSLPVPPKRVDAMVVKR